MSASGVRIDIYTEDRTGGGLQSLLVAAARAERGRLGKAHLLRPSRGGWSNARSNAELIKACGKYGFLRSDGLDAVFFVIDLKEGEHLVKLPAIRPTALTQDVPRIVTALEKRMRDEAAASCGNRWAELESGFRPHVLHWERESLILPVTDALGLGPSHPNPADEMGPAAWLSQRHRQTVKRPYDKGTDGFAYLKRITEDPALVARVLASNASVKAMVDALVAL